jgi:hypothetical protein
MSYKAIGSIANGTTSVAPSRPSGVVNGDVLLAVITDHATTGSSSAPTGWTRLGGAAGSAGRCQVFGAVVGASGLTGTSWTFSGLTTRAGGYIVAYSYAGATAAAILDTTVSARINASGTTGATAITTATDGAIVVAIFSALASGSTWSAEACASGPTLTERGDSPNSTFLSIAVADGVLATAGSTGVSSATMGTAGANAAILLALKPATLLACPAPSSLALTPNAPARVAVTRLQCPAPGATTVGTFALVQGNRGLGTNSTLSTYTAPVAPTPGNIVIVAMYGDSAAPVTSLVDGNGNAYTLTANSPNNATGGINGDGLSLAYLLNAPSNASATLKATTASAVAVGFRVQEFSCSLPGATFGSDAMGSSTSAVASTTTPSLSPAVLGSLLYATVYTGSGVPAAGSPWTADQAGAGSISNGEYILSSPSGSTAVKFTLSPSDVYEAGIVAIAPPSVTNGGKLSLTGNAPTITAGSSNSTNLDCPTPATISLAGKIAKIAARLVIVSAAALTLSPKTPALKFRLPAPAPTSIALTANAPTLRAVTRLQLPTPVSITLAGKSPSISSIVRLQVSAPAALTITGKTAAIRSRILAPAAAALALQGRAPAISNLSRIFAPSPASIALVPRTPTIRIRAALPVPAAITLAGKSPSISSIVRLQVSSPASIAVIGKTAAIQIRAALPTPTALELTGQAAAIRSWMLAPAAAALTLQGRAPAIQVLAANNLACPAPSSIVLVPRAPAIRIRAALPAPAALALQGRAPALARVLYVQAPSPSSLQVTGKAPSTRLHLAVAAPGSILLAGKLPAVRARIATPIPAALGLASHAPTMLVRAALPAPTALTISSSRPHIASRLVAADPRAIVLVGHAPSLRSAGELILDPRYLVIAVARNYAAVAAARDYELVAGSRNYGVKWGMTQNLSSKDPAEIIVLSFDFTAALEAGETISGCTVTATDTMRNEDASSTMLVDDPVRSGDPIVKQKVAGGVDGHSYIMRAEVDLSSGRRLAESGVLSVRVLG